MAKLGDKFKYFTEQIESIKSVLTAMDQHWCLLTDRLLFILEILAAKRDIIQDERGNWKPNPDQVNVFYFQQIHNIMTGKDKPGPVPPIPPTAPVETPHDGN